MALARDGLRNLVELRLAYAMRLSCERRSDICCEANPAKIRATRGFTTDLQQRFKKNNKGASVHTAKYRPWRLVAYFAFEDERKAREFESYLKTGSRKAFANKRLW